MEGMESPLYVSGTQSVHTDDGSQCGSTAATSVANHWEQDNIVTFLVLRNVREKKSTGAPSDREAQRTFFWRELKLARI
jgi:hypothetical protein